MGKTETWRILRNRMVYGRVVFEWVWALHDVTADYLEFPTEREAASRAAIYNVTARDGWHYQAKRYR